MGVQVCGLKKTSFRSPTSFVQEPEEREGIFRNFPRSVFLCIPALVSLFYSCLCVVYVFLDAGSLTEVFPCFFLGCKANARVNLAKTGHGPHSPKFLCLFYVLFVLCRSVYCLCVNVYCTTATGWQPNCS